MTLYISSTLHTLSLSLDCVKIFRCSLIIGWWAGTRCSRIPHIFDAASHNLHEHWVYSNVLNSAEVKAHHITLSLYFNRMAENFRSDCHIEMTQTGLIC